MSYLRATIANPINNQCLMHIWANRRSIMEGSGDGSPQSSMCMVKAAELFPKPILEKEEEKLTVRFTELAGESVRYLGQTDDGILALSNYRLFLQKNSTGAEVSVPLGLIESTQVRDLFHLIVNCKDASTVRCSFATSEQCSEWHRRITLSIGVPETLEALFAFPFHAWASESPTLNQDNEWAGRLQRVGSFDDEFRREAERLQFDLQGAWRISQANAEFKLCPSYPRLLLVPACISDDTLQNVASFRSSRRIPAVVWRHQRTGAVIARCSQPEVGWLGWRNSKDEQLLKALSDACSFDRGTQDRTNDGTRRTRTQTDSSEASSDGSPPRSPEGSHEEVEMDEPKKILIVDARSYTSAVTNRARGGGCECAEYYPSAEIQFMSLGNIHVIRKSFHALRQLCASQADIPNWLGLLERTLWLQHLSGLLAASMVVCHAIERNGRPVLVHCSDGWDRTPQIVATAQLCLDPYYRTIEGFRVLVEREWLSFGHKFADRCGHGPGSDETNERCPVFLQWLDCVHQIHRQFPCSFEFDMGYLIKLAQHSHSCLFGTFLCNTVKERQENSVPDRTFSVWPFLSGPIYKNHLYVPNRERVLWPAHNVRDLRLWTEVYLGSWGGHNQPSPAEVTDYPTTTVSAGGAEVVPGPVGIRSIGSSVVDTGPGITVGGGSASVNVVVAGMATSSTPSSSPEANGSMTKTRSYSDIKEATSGGVMTRRSSDPSMTLDPRTGGPSTLNLSQEESSIDSNLSSDRETSPDLPSIDDRLLHRGVTASSFIQHATEKLQSLTQELNQSDDELEQAIKNQRNLVSRSTARCPADSNVDAAGNPFSSSTPSSLYPNGSVGGINSLAAAAAATLIPTATTNVRPSFTTTSISNGATALQQLAGNEGHPYSFQPIVPELPTKDVSRCSPNLSRESSSSPTVRQQNVVLWPETIDENTARIIKIESYHSSTVGGGNKDVLDGGGGGFVHGANRTVIGRPVMAGDDMMMESVDLTIGGSDDSSFVGDKTHSASPNRLESPGLNDSSLSPNLWHGSIETSTDTLVPVDQYPPPLGPIDTSAFSKHHQQNLPSLHPLASNVSNVTEDDGKAVRDVYERRKSSLSTQEQGSHYGSNGVVGGGSISLDVGNSDNSQLSLVNAKGSEATTAPNDNSGGAEVTGDSFAAKAQTGDSNGCDFTSDSHAYDRKISNQSTLAFTGDTLPKDQPDYRHQQHHPPDCTLESDRDGVRGEGGIGRTVPTSTFAQNSNVNGSSTVNYNKQKINNGVMATVPPVSSGQTTTTSNLLTSMTLMDESIIIQPQFQQLEINGKHPPNDGGAAAAAAAASGYPTIMPLRRRRNSSNSKHDLMSPCKPTNGSISPSATHSRFSTPGARSLPLTPPSVPYASDRPPVATFSCPDGLAHALSEQNLRLQQIVYEHRLREEALQRELYATRLALLKKTCQHCCSSSAQPQYGNEDPVPVSISFTSVAAFTTATTTTSAMGDRIGRVGESNHSFDNSQTNRSASGDERMSTFTSISNTATTTVTTTTTECFGMAAGSTWLGASVYGLLSEAVSEDSGKNLLVFSDEENEIEDDQKDGVSISNTTAAEERCLCEAILQHNRRFVHNVRMWRTVRQFLERTRQKRTVFPSSVVLSRETVKPVLSEAFSLEDPISEYYAESDVEDENDNSSGSSVIEETDGQVNIALERPFGGEENDLDIILSGSGGGGGGSDEEDDGDSHHEDVEKDDAELSSHQLMVDSMNENASNCSWEAVDDRSAPSSGANSSQQMQYSSSGVGGSTSVLWVPDHAVTRCTTCQTVFWIGLRKHHCRSCGQIFCADCSDYTAHLPEERLYQPVRLCGPCYQRISSMTVPSPSSVSTTGGGSTLSTAAVSQSASTSVSNIVTGASVHNGASNALNEDSNALLQHRTNVTAAAAASMMMRDRITSMSQIQSLLATECSSEASRASESCCKQNVTAATN
uniref:phosphatidylinositol-3,5-bisphosphate 3-phosphatase n=1 Tax=Anopheles christyi TaxID=43041 RepID=A0A182K188_9DIPT